MTQQSIFSTYKITKPIRLIELFAGIGSQAKALKNIGADFEHYRVCEFDKYAIKSYNAIHGTNFETSDIRQLTADDLGIVDTDKYEYILTYSFPCTDLSVAGQQKGMSKGSGTRSGLLWEVERLLKDCKWLPQILLMENVPQVHGKKNIADFEKWCEFLRQLGYTNFWQDLNAKHYGMPQNRDRCFMVSILGDGEYVFPRPTKLTKLLKDMLEDSVDEKFYLRNARIQSILETHFNCNKLESRLPKNDIMPTLCARDYKDPKLVQVGSLISKPYDKMHESSRRVYSISGLCPTINTCGGGNLEPKIVCEQRSDEGLKFFKDCCCGTLRTIDGCGDKRVITFNEKFIAYDEQNGYMRQDGTVGTLTTDGSTPKHNNRIVNVEDCSIRKLTPKECFRLMGFTDSDFEKAQAVNSNSQLYKQAGNTIVVQVLEAIFKQLL